MSYAHPSDYRAADEDEDEDEGKIDYKFEPTYIVFITGVRAKTRDDIQVFDIATKKTFRFLNKNYFDSGVDLACYIMNTGLDSPREQLIFVFDENACILEKKRNIGGLRPPRCRPPARGIQERCRVQSWMTMKSINKYMLMFLTYV